jgi:hypothetical protein
MPDLKKALKIRNVRSKTADFMKIRLFGEGLELNLDKHKIDFKEILREQA